MSSEGEEDEDLGKEDPVNVIDDKLLTKAIQSQKPKEGSHIFLPFHEVLQLRLEYGFIPKIEGLQQFAALAKLQLNSNSIAATQSSAEKLRLSINDIFNLRSV